MGKKTFFASDFHLGIDAGDTAAEREQRVVRWLEQIAPEAEAIYLVGDIFDFWFEYKSSIPKGFSKFLGAIAALRRADIPIYFFTGNHDMWMFDYFPEEYGIPVYREPIQRTIGGQRFYIGHGDGLGPGDRKYKMLKKFFASPACQWAFGWIHPNLGMRLAHFWSKRSRLSNPDEKGFLGPGDEWLLTYCEEVLPQVETDFFVFGHRHLPIDYLLSDGRTRYINLGEWMFARSYGVLDNGEFRHQFFENPQGRVFP